MEIEDTVDPELGSMMVCAALGAAFSSMFNAWDIQSELFSSYKEREKSGTWGKSQV